MAKTLEELIKALRTIEAHRTGAMEKTLRKEYSKALRELQHYLADEYLRYGVDGKLDFGLLSRSGEYARFLDEVLHKANKLTGNASAAVRNIVEEVYTRSYEGVISAVSSLSGGTQLASVLQPLSRASAEVLRAAVQNPISGLTLNETLEYNRRKIIYDIKRTVTNGIMNGDRYNTMAGRLKDNLNGDYKKAVRIVRTETHRVQEQGRHEGISVTDRKLSEAGSNVRMCKIWRSMKDNRVRPQRAALKNPSKKVTFASKADHVKMEGVEVLLDEYFELGARVKTLTPGSSGNAANDINCRCFLEYVVKEKDGKEVKDLQKSLLEETNENGIIKDIQKDEKGQYTITDEAIDKVTVPKLKQLTTKQNFELQQAQKDLLSELRNHPVGTEGARTYNMDMKLLNKAVGEQGARRVYIPRQKEPHISIHNHPSGLIFSPRDIEGFTMDGNMQIMTVVGNNGKSFSLEKLSEFNASGWIDFYNSQLKKNSDDVLGFITTLMKGTRKYGISFNE